MRSRPHERASGNVISVHMGVQNRRPAVRAEFMFRVEDGSCCLPDVQRAIT